jgi:general stress protein 26
MADDDRLGKVVRRAIARHSFCTLATVSAAGDPHVVGVVYVAVDGVLYLSTLDTTRKARNVRGSGRAAVCIPVRRYPVGPPFCVQFQASAEVLSRHEPTVDRLIRAGRLKKILAFDVLDDPATCFLRVTPDRRVSTYGVGVPLMTLLRDVTGASRTVELA